MFARCTATAGADGHVETRTCRKGRHLPSHFTPRPPPPPPQYRPAKGRLFPGAQGGPERATQLFGSPKEGPGPLAQGTEGDFGGGGGGGRSPR